MSDWRDTLTREELYDEMEDLAETNAAYGNDLLKALKWADSVKQERDEARRWARAWKEAAINHRAWRHTLADVSVKYIRETIKLQKFIEAHEWYELETNEHDRVYGERKEG